MRRVLHELRVHQIELRMQNEELRRTQVELETARARYFDLYDLAPVGYCIISLQGLILEANLTAISLLGTVRAALLKQPITRFIFPDDQDIYYLHRKQVLKSGEPLACELRMVRPDRTTFWARLTATTGHMAPPGTEQGAESQPVSRIVLSDISERKQVEAEKARLEALLLEPRPATPDRLHS
jgi:PAS domain S-box-containing protein